MASVPSSGGLKPSSNEAIDYFRHELAQGRPWAEVLLETMGLWTAPHERFQGRQFTYLIEGEAFDWLLLAERLLLEAPNAATQEERERLLFLAELPESVTSSRFQEALGEAKYRAYLNFFYGVMVEEALMQAVEEELLKEQSSRGITHRRGVDDGIMQRLYGATEEVLLRRFSLEHGRRYRKTLTLGQWKAFVYWLFKLRLGRSDTSRLASDTRKGLRYLNAISQVRRSFAISPTL